MKINIEIEVPMEDSLEVTELMDENKFFERGARMVATSIILFEDVEEETNVECEMFDLLTEFKEVLRVNRIKFEETPI
jgi:adenine C2-methylase RlmN of 23S rRNA A2503 and tRNA A37